jgi:hypothetical protein
MTVKFSFQYCLLHYCHDPVTGEFLNIGLVMYNRANKYFNARLLTKYKRISSTFPGLDGEYYRKYVTYLQTLLDNLSIKIGSPQINFKQEWPERLDELLDSILPKDDSSIYFDLPKEGLAKDLNILFEDLYSRLVERYVSDSERTTRHDEDVWNFYKRPLQEQNLLTHLQSHTITTSNDTIEFPHGWKNGKWNVLQPLSFDLSTPTYIKKKAREWLGTAIVLDNSKELSHLYLLLGKPSSQQEDLNKAYSQTKDILNVKLKNFSIQLIEEDEAQNFALDIKPIIERDLGIVK